MKNSLSYQIHMEKGVPSPEEFFGFNMGADRKLARWDKLVEYYYALDEKSDRIKVTELGKTTEGNPFILAVITSPENHRNLNKIRAIGPTLAYSEDLSEEEEASIIKGGKAVIAMAMSIHANEVGGAQMAPELAYELVTGDTYEVRRILDEVVLLLIPSSTWARSTRAARCPGSTTSTSATTTTGTSPS
jgi:hypothetical protein